MLEIRIEFTNNQGSFALDAIAQTIGGTWSGKSSTETFGIVRDVDEENEAWAKEVLESHEKVESYKITTQW